MADNVFENDQNPLSGPAPDGADMPQVGVITQYVKDLSFENPNAPASLQNMTAAKPAIDVNVNVGVHRLGDDVYEVELKISATANNTLEDGKNQVAFAVELVYGSLFGLRNVPEEAVRAFLLVQAPMLMFPFARRIIADASRDGGFPPLLLEPINFEALYRAQMAQDQQGAEEPTPETLN
ncbi:protein-export chaperone SecB [Pseudokordiimonas caeni]|uniref:protein-export chaperone SecB n=1 Tax=Pseudokordiimonas caeni TaxID=2997908 RepID=UPI0028115479|nr:protein-export chaperone SecB [Pseudokordiimonas caeni]